MVSRPLYLMMGIIIAGNVVFILKRAAGAKRNNCHSYHHSQWVMVARWVCDTICVVDWSIDWLVDCFTVWLIVWLIDWLTGWYDSLTDWLTDWLIGWLIDLLIDWLIDWLRLTSSLLLRRTMYHNPTKLTYHWTAYNEPKIQIYA